jgi:hypothetical protein
MSGRSLTARVFGCCHQAWPGVEGDNCIWINDLILLLGLRQNALPAWCADISACCLARELTDSQLVAHPTTAVVALSIHIPRALGQHAVSRVAGLGKEVARRHHCSSKQQTKPLRLQNTSLGVHHLVFIIWCSSFGVHHLVFIIWCSSFGVHVLNLLSSSLFTTHP